MKEAWDTIKMLWIGNKPAREASTHQVHVEFGVLTFKEGERITNFGIRIITLATNQRTLSDNVTDIEVVKKLL